MKIYKNPTFCKYTLHNLHRQVLQTHCPKLLLNWFKELSCLMCSGSRDHNCGNLQLIASKPKYTVLFLSVSNSEDF